MVTVAHPTPHAKRHLERSSCFATIHLCDQRQTDRQTSDRQTDRQTMNIVKYRLHLYATHIWCGVIILGKKLPSIKVRPTALAWPTTLTFTYNPDLQSHVSYGHDLLMHKSSRSTVSQFWRQSGNRWTDRCTSVCPSLFPLCFHSDKQRQATALPSVIFCINAISKKHL